MRVIGWCAPMSIHEIVLSETKPETEWVRGRALQKVSPTFRHARVQSCFVTALSAYAGDRGRAGTEWRFRVAPPGEVRRPLVPDVAYVSMERLRSVPREEIECPTFPPDVAVEILSPDEDPRDVADKVDVYLRAGVRLVIELGTRTRTARLHDGARPVQLGEDDVLRHAILPGFELALRPFFSEALDLPL
ncbi:MAG TPA: Uma2 family endonuclease [Candidatus Baltobacteraceae bacterium]